jgi:hypothetical protein
MSMKKRILILFATLFTAASAVHAQSITTMKAEIPFDFVVGNSTLQAGTYTITPANWGVSTTEMRSADLKDVVLMAPCACALETHRHQNELVFQVIGGRYFLWQIWTADYDEGLQLSIKPSRELEAANASPMCTVVIKAVLAKA